MYNTPEKHTGGNGRSVFEAVRRFDREPRSKRLVLHTARRLRGLITSPEPSHHSAQVRVLILGLDNAGKTTILYKLQMGEVRSRDTLHDHGDIAAP